MTCYRGSTSEDDDYNGDGVDDGDDGDDDVGDDD